ncbi:MAG: hypothetical protein JJ939_12510 [Alphaproteobacteria bacterium]|nr:hypothetical protein [Alphaproteobacteria bacterium]MBO6629235.1 hypothetical protein [Alphaproteobacteria bacterium]
MQTPANDNETTQSVYEFIFKNPEERAKPLARVKRFPTSTCSAAITFALWILILSPIIRQFFWWTRVGMLRAIALLVVVFWRTAAYADDCPELTVQQSTAHVDERIFVRLPTSDPILFLGGYVTSYDTERRVPRWTAWLVTQEFTDAPRRESRW